MRGRNVLLLLPAQLLVSVRLRGGGGRQECHGANSHRAIASTARPAPLARGSCRPAGCSSTPPSWMGAEGRRTRRLAAWPNRLSDPLCPYPGERSAQASRLAWSLYHHHHHIPPYTPHIHPWVPLGCPAPFLDTVVLYDLFDCYKQMSPRQIHKLSDRPQTAI